MDPCAVACDRVFHTIRDDDKRDHDIARSRDDGDPGKRMPHACTLDVRSVVRFSDTVLIACSLTVATLHRTLNSRQSAREREGERERERERERASQDQPG